MFEQNFREIKRIFFLLFKPVKMRRMMILKKCLIFTKFRWSTAMHGFWNPYDVQNIFQCLFSRHPLQKWPRYIFSKVMCSVSQALEVKMSIVYGLWSVTTEANLVENWGPIRPSWFVALNLASNLKRPQLNQIDWVLWPQTLWRIV